MKTILFLFPIRISVRNFLFTGVVERLAATPDVRVIAVTIAPDVFERYGISSGKVVVERFPPRRRGVSGFLHAILERRFYQTSGLNSARILSKGPLVRGFRELVLERLLSQPFPRSTALYRWIRAAADRAPWEAPEVEHLFDRYQPSLLVSTHPTSMFEYDFLRRAERDGIPSLGIIKSWDTLTTAGYLPVRADHYLVWNRVMKADLQALHGVPDESIAVTGIPQFDAYTDAAGVPPRATLLHGLKLDPAKKTILYATSPPAINAEDPEMVRRLALAFADRAGVQVLARLHQLDSEERYAGIAYPNLAFQLPGAYVPATGAARAASPDDLRDALIHPSFINGLRDTLVHSDVVVNTCSTTSLDAVAMDRPVVNIAFDLATRDYYRSCRRYYDFEHFQPVLKSGATKIARSFEEMVSLIDRYLRDPALESAERARLRETMCYRLDGRSAARVAEGILRVAGAGETTRNAVDTPDYAQATL